jgi:homoserine acetyltransferase
VRGLDLRRECERIRAAGIPVTVIGCVSDTLVTASHSRALAEALGARYEELDSRGGHMWMLDDARRFAAVVAGR